MSGMIPNKISKILFRALLTNYSLSNYNYKAKKEKHRGINWYSSTKT